MAEPTTNPERAPESDPSTWPALFHRLTRSSKDAARLLLLLLGIVASLAGGVLLVALLLDVSLLQLGIFWIERAP